MYTLTTQLTRLDGEEAPAGLLAEEEAPIGCLNKDSRGIQLN